MRLLNDISRCTGRFDFAPDGKWCERRETCARYKVFSTGGNGDKRISVFMAKPDCEDFIDATTNCD